MQSLGRWYLSTEILTQAYLEKFFFILDKHILYMLKSFDACEDLDAINKQHFQDSIFQEPLNFFEFPFRTITVKHEFLIFAPLHTTSLS